MQGYESLQYAPVNEDILDAQDVIRSLDAQVQQFREMRLQGPRQESSLKPQIALSIEDKCHFDTCKLRRIQLPGTDLFCSEVCRSAWESES